MTLYCEVPVKDSSASSRRDAIAYANRHEELWKIKENRSEKRKRMMARTNLEGRCGSCRFFKYITVDGENSCYGNCSKGRVTRPRTTKACKEYERANE